MSTRIRYIKQDNILISKDYYKVRGTQYKISIYLNDMLFTIDQMDMTSNPSTIQSGHASTINQLKIKAKKSLTDLGVKFKKENRFKNEL